MKFSIIFCVFLFFSDFAFGQKVTMEIQIMGIDESPSHLEEIIIYDSSIDSIVFYNKNYEKSSLLVDLDTTHLYTFYGQTNMGYNKKTIYSRKEELNLIDLGTIRRYLIYTDYNLCTSGFDELLSDGSGQFTKENTQEIKRFNEAMKHIEMDYFIQVRIDNSPFRF